MWRAWASDGQAYPRYFRKHVVPELKAIDGFLGARLLKRKQGREIEFVVETRWKSLSAIRAFAGRNLEQAVVMPGAAATLKRHERKVRHYEIAAKV